MMGNVHGFAVEKVANTELSSLYLTLTLMINFNY